MPRRFQHEVILIGCLAVLFVLVCPYTPSPILVAKDKPATAPVVGLFLLLPFALLVAFRGIVMERTERCAVPADRMLALTCTRLC
jgi:uncharacterized membrane protein